MWSNCFGNKRLFNVLRYVQTLEREHSQSATFYMFTLHLKGNNFISYGAPKNKPEREGVECGSAWLEHPLESQKYVVEAFCWRLQPLLKSEMTWGFPKTVGTYCTNAIKQLVCASLCVKSLMCSRKAKHPAA